MDLHLFRKNAPATGASSLGLSRVIVLALAREGATLAIIARCDDLLCAPSKEIARVCSIDTTIIEDEL